MSYELALSSLLVELKDKLLATPALGAGAREHHDYGTGNLLKDGEMGIMTPLRGVIRASDKIERMRHILKGGAEVMEETIEDTWLDLAGYALQAILMRRGTLSEDNAFEEALERAENLRCPKCGNPLLFRTWMDDIHEYNAAIACSCCNRRVEFDGEMITGPGAVQALIIRNFYFANVPVN